MSLVTQLRVTFLRTLYRMAYRVLRVYWWAVRPSTQGAYVAVWCKNQLLVIRNTYKSCLTFPAGGVSPGESAAVAAARELYEEVGIHAEVSELIPVGKYHSTSEFKRDACAMFELRFEEFPHVSVDRVEVHEAGFWNVDDLSGVNLSDIVAQYLVDVSNRCEMDDETVTGESATLSI